MFIDHISAEVMLFFILYGITGVIPFIAAVYLLFRRGNAFAPGVEPPLRLRRWAAAFFASAALGHVWWLLFYFFSHDMNSTTYVVVVLLDSVGLLTTMAGTLLSMLQDRRRSTRPVLVAMIPFIACGSLQIFFPHEMFIIIASVYILTIQVLFSVYMVFAVRHYGQWLNDNYADLENKRVWLSQMVALFCLFLFILYSLVDTEPILFFLTHIVELVLFGLLLWRVETLPLLAENSVETDPAAASEPPIANTDTIDLARIEQLLAEHCVGRQLYLQHDLNVTQLAQAIGTNRFYLGQYFSRRSTTYNAYINTLRINHFVSLYHEATAAQRSFTAQQLAYNSGYHSYSTFSLAFKQRMGQTVTAWMHQAEA